MDTYQHVSFPIERGLRYAYDSIMKSVALLISLLLSMHTACHAVVIDYVLTDGTSYATIGFSQMNVTGSQQSSPISVNGVLLTPQAASGAAFYGPAAGFWDTAGGHFWSITFALDGTITYEKPDALDPKLNVLTFGYDPATFSGHMTLGTAPVPDMGSTGVLLGLVFLPCALIFRRTASSA